MFADIQTVEKLEKNLGNENAHLILGAIDEYLINTKKDIKESTKSLKAQVYDELRQELATKEFVRAEIQEVRTEIQEVRAELKAEIQEVRTEIQEVKTELKTDIESLRGDFKNLSLMMKILIGLTVFGLTLLNPNFTLIIEKIFAK
jgi:vacuolar-type H+-ATPase subunit I/STV1